jgi:hypothetical protein
VTDSEALLFTDKEGHPADLGRVISDGLDGGYEDRIPGLVELLHSGTPEERLYAETALLSWGHPVAFEQLTEWTRDPEDVPWANAPVVFARMSGRDGAWEMLADGLLNTHFLPNRDRLRPHRTQAARDLLRLADRVDFDRTLTAALGSDRAMLAAAEPELRDALDRSLARVSAGDRPGFDLATQAAGLGSALAPLDDAAAAAYARRLIECTPGNARMLRELADAMARGTGQATLAVLDRLRSSADGAVRAEAERALKARGAT